MELNKEIEFIQERRWHCAFFGVSGSDERTASLLRQLFLVDHQLTEQLTPMKWELLHQ